MTEKEGENLESFEDYTKKIIVPSVKSEQIKIATSSFLHINSKF